MASRATLIGTAMVKVLMVASWHLWRLLGFGKHFVGLLGGLSCMRPLSKVENSSPVILELQGSKERHGQQREPESLGRCSLLHPHATPFCS